MRLKDNDTTQEQIQLQCMKDALHYLDTIEIPGPDFECDVAGGGDGPTATD